MRTPELCGQPRMRQPWWRRACGRGGAAARAQAGREVVALAREMLGGNGIVSDFLVAKQFCDMEVRAGFGPPVWGGCSGFAHWCFRAVLVEGQPDYTW